MNLVRKHFSTHCKQITFHDAQNNKHACWTFSFTSKVKGSSVPLKVLLVLGKWSHHDDQNIHTLITNDPSLSPKDLIRLYRLRWGIERVFQELKDTFSFDQYQVRHKTSILRYWSLCLIAWTLVYWTKQNAFLSKILSIRPQSFNEYKAAINLLLLYDSTCTLSKNNVLANHYFKIKSQRFKNMLRKAA